MSTAKHPHQYAGKADVFPERSSDQCTEFLEALIAACSIIAHADGKVVPAERRKLLSELRTTRFLASYSREEVLERLLVHERSFASDPETANDRAAVSVKPMASRRADALFLMDACRGMILADGIAEPAEFQALHKIRKILGLESAFERRRN